MERLTIRTPTGAALKMDDNYPSEDAARHDLMVRYRIAMEKLAAYEDTGMEPQAFEELSNAIGGKTGADADCWCECGDALQLELDDNNELAIGCFGCHKFVKVSELIQLYKAQAEGRLVLLPCKIGDCLYAYTRDIVSTFRVSGFDIFPECIWVQWYIIDGISGNIGPKGVTAGRIGKTVFLTRVEAEEAAKAGVSYGQKS